MFKINIWINDESGIWEMVTWHIRGENGRHLEGTTERKEIVLV